MKYFIYSLVFLFAFYSCKKDEGFGGQATVKGKIVERVYDESFTILQDQIPATKEDVFLVMGDDSYFGEKLETGSDGTFEINYLQPGDYSVYYYSEDSASGIAGNTISKVTEFSISKSQKNVDLGTLVKYSTIRYNKGTVTIKGKIIEKAFDENYKVLQYESPAAEEDVYLIVGSGTTSIERVRTSSDGTFEINNLQLGQYSVFIYSEDSVTKDPESKISASISFTLSKNDTILDLGTITKLKTLKYDEGTSIIKGVIMMDKWNNDFTVKQETNIPVQNEDVFLVYSDRPYLEDRVRTMYNGSFAFPNLIKGNYKVYVLSDNPSGSSKKVTFIKVITINRDNQTVPLDTITINKN